MRSNYIIDDLIKLHKSVVETDSDVNLALSKALEEANAQLQQQQQFAVALRKFQEQLLQDLNASGMEAQSYFQKMVKSMETAVQNLLGRLSKASKEAEIAVMGLSKVSSK